MTIAQAALGLLTLCVAMSAASQTSAAGKFRASSVTHTGHVTLEAPPEKTFPLFTPEGERAWAEGWDPEVLFPADGQIREGLVFRTPDHGGTVWVLMKYDQASFTIAYSATAAGALVREIEVHCRPAAGNRTEVLVTDTYVGLSEHGNMFVGQLDEASYSKKMAHWQEVINRALKGQPPSPQR